MAKASTLHVVLIPARLNDVWNPVGDATVKSVLPTPRGARLWGEFVE
jgi:hypothetical protein